jgi:hypothetical protein
LSEVAAAFSSSSAADAARILGAADEGYRSRGIVRPPREEERIEPTRAQLRETLGTQTNERLHHEGSSLSLDEAIAEVLATGERGLD